MRRSELMKELLFFPVVCAYCIRMHADIYRCPETELGCGRRRRRFGSSLLGTFDWERALVFSNESIDVSYKTAA